MRRTAPHGNRRPDGIAIGRTDDDHHLCPSTHGALCGPSSPAMTAVPAEVLDLDRYRDHISRRLEKTFSQHIGDPPQPCQLSDAEWREVLDTCNAAVASAGLVISDRRWRSYAGVVMEAQSARHLRDREAFKAVCILTDVIFVWDDMDTSRHDLNRFLPALRTICNRYYQAEDAQQAFEAARTLITSDHLFGNTPLKNTLCTTSLEQYFRFRVTDAGADLWMRMSCPIYQDDRLTAHCRSGLAALMITRGVTVVNDAYSFARESSLGQLANCFYLCPPGDDTAFYVFFESLLDGIVEDITCIKAFDRVTRDVLLDVIYGNFMWTLHNERYRQPSNDVNTRIR